MAQEREALADLGKVFDVVCAACANASVALASPGTASTSRGEAATQAKAMPSGIPAVTGEELLAEVFSPMAEEAGVDGLYLRAAMVEFLRAADAAGVAVPPAMHALLVRCTCTRVPQRALPHQQPMTQVDLLVRDECAHQLPMWAPLLLPPPAVRAPLVRLRRRRLLTPARTSVQSRAQPFAASAAHGLDRAAATVDIESVRQLAVDARRRAHAHDTLVRDMLAAGEVLQALRYVRRNRVESVPPAVFVEAAAAQDDPRVFSSVFHFCSTHVPGFASLPDYPVWSGLMPQ